MEAIGALRGVQLLAVSGLLALALAGLLGWRLAEPAGSETVPDPTPGAEATPGATSG